MVNEDLEQLLSKSDQEVLAARLQDLLRHGHGQIRLVVENGQLTLIAAELSYLPESRRSRSPNPTLPPFPTRRGRS